MTEQGAMMKTLFLHPPSFDGFDGGAGSRYQAKREIRSFWYPTWLAQPAALVPGSRLIDAPPARLKLADLLPLAGDYELAVLHTSTPSFASDVKVAEALKDANPRLKIGLVGAKVAVEPEDSLRASAALDFVAREEFDFTIKEAAEGRALDAIDGLSYRSAGGSIVHNRDRAVLEDMDRLPFVTEVYKRDLRIENYFIGYLKHPYVSLYTGRGCRSKCTFCLWPQTVGGHRYRVRSVGHVIEEIRLAKEWFPQVQEFFFDDDTFTDDRPRAEAIARELGRLGVTWSCNAKANVPRATLEILRDNGLRLLLVGYELGNQQILNNIKKGMRIDIARRFTKDCHELGITIHGTFILGLPGESRETIEETIRFAGEINPHTIQVSLAAPYPGTELHRQAVENGWLDAGHAELTDERGRADRAVALPAPVAHRDLRVARNVLQALLLSAEEDRRTRRRDDPEPADDAPPPARGRRVFPLPAPPGDDRLKRLIVCADDFGLDPAVNEAVERAHRHGILSTASLMVAGPAAADAVARARLLPGLRVGLHLVLVDGRPVLPAGDVGGLVGADGKFDRNMARAGVRFFFLPQIRRQLAKEIRAQFEAFRATGLGLDHVNAHKHMHLHPTVAGLIVEIGRDYGMYAVRVPAEPVAALRLAFPDERRRAPLYGPWTRALRLRLRRAGLLVNDHVFGLAWSGAMVEDRVLRLVPHLPDGISEMYFHPAAERSPRLVAAMPRYRHPEELAALLSPAVERRIAETGISLASYGDLRASGC